MFWSVRKAMIGKHSPRATRAQIAASLIRSRMGIDAGGSPPWLPELIDQTFSTSGRPSRPDGMKISTTARIEKAATSL